MRGDGHFSNPELMQLSFDNANTDFIFGMTGNAVLSKLTRPYLDAVRTLHQKRCEQAQYDQRVLPQRSRTYHEVEYAAKSWPQPFRVILKAEVMALGENPRFVVTSLDLPNPQCVYRDLYCARGQGENYIKHMKNDLACDRTSDHAFLANHLRLYFSCAAYVLHHSLRTETLSHTELSQAQPGTIMLKLFKLAVRVVAYKDRVKLQLPSQYPFKSLCTPSMGMN